MEASRRVDRIGSHISASGMPSKAAHDALQDIVVVDAIRTPITRAKKVRLRSWAHNDRITHPVAFGITSIDNWMASWSKHLSSGAMTCYIRFRCYRLILRFRMFVDRQ